MKKGIVLPPQRDMLRRLMEVCDGPRIDSFYARLLKHSSQEMNAIGVIVMLVNAIHEFVESEHLPPMTNVLYTLTPNFIDALTDNEEVREEAKTFFKKIQIRECCRGNG